MISECCGVFQTFVEQLEMMALTVGSKFASLEDLELAVKLFDNVAATLP